MKQLFSFIVIIITTFLCIQLTITSKVTTNSGNLLQKTQIKWNEIQPNDIEVDTLQPALPAKPKKPRKPQSRIFGGAEVSTAEFLKFKHIVKILAYKNTGVFSCGGSIISANVLVTAAHCLTKANEGEVFFGLRSQNELYKAQSQEVYSRHFRIHPQWNQETMANDIGLIVLPAKIKFSESVGPIALPTGAQICSKYESKDSIIAGWGQQTDDDSSTSDILKTSNVKIDKSSLCKENYGYKFNEATMICVDASKNSGTCRGDSGGPLVIFDDDKVQQLIGVVSYGAVGCLQRKSRVFTCLAAYEKWIKDNSK